MQEGLTHMERKMTPINRGTCFSCARGSRSPLIHTLQRSQKLINTLSWPYHWDLVGERQLISWQKIIPSDQFNLIWTWKVFTTSQPTLELGLCLCGGGPSSGGGKPGTSSASPHPTAWTGVINVCGAIRAGEAAGTLEGCLSASDWLKI